MDSDTVGTVFRDAVMLALLGFVAMVVLMLAHLRPPAEDETARAAGNLAVEATWPADMNADIDLWVQGPGDRPVGYSRKSGTVFNLLRDDLGKTNDLTDQNYEFAFSRGIPAGSYTVNVHLYSIRTAAPPIPIRLTVALHAPGQSRVVIDVRSVELVHNGEELTVVRFDLDAQGRVVPGSIHDLPKPLRAVVSGAP